MHEVVVHVQPWRGGEAAGAGDPEAILLTRHLVVDGQEVFPDPGEFLTWALEGQTPLEILCLAIRNPPKELKARFPLAERLEYREDGVLRLPVRSVAFVPYEQPPPPSELELSLAG